MDEFRISKDFTHDDASDGGGGGADTVRHHHHRHHRVVVKMNYSSIRIVKERDSLTRTRFVSSPFNKARDTSDAQSPFK